MIVVFASHAALPSPTIADLTLAGNMPRDRFVYTVRYMALQTGRDILRRRSRRRGSACEHMSKSRYAPRLRPERLIAAGPIVLAVASLFAVWYNLDEPVRFAPIAYGVLVGYVAYAFVLSAYLWRSQSISPRWQILTHATDLVCFCLFIFFTEGPASPFTVYFVFALLTATLRWQARGTFWTAIPVLGAFLLSGVYFALVLGGPAFDLRAFIVRSVYLLVLAALLGYVGTQDQRTLREMWGLAAWPHMVRRDSELLARDLLEYASGLLIAPKVVLAWAEHDSTWQQIAASERGSWSHERQPAEDGQVIDALRDRAFIRTREGRTLAQEQKGAEFSIWEGNPLDDDFASRFAPTSVLCVPFRAESCEGRLLVLDKPDATLDDLVLAEIIVGVIAGRLDAFYLGERLRLAAATEERIRLARDLHDSVLQSFTGIALRLEVIRRMMETDRSAAALALEDVQRVLASEQRDLRFFIQELKPLAHAADSADLDGRLRELAQRMEREWDLHVELRMIGPFDRLPSSLSSDVYLIVREALVNAARHGGASQADVTLNFDKGAIAIAVTDNGCGFPFSGRYSAGELARLNLGPKTLRERVEAIHGSLVIESGPRGAELNVVVPSVSAA